MAEVRTREDLIRVFKALRKEGIAARANFMCCGSCAAAAITPGPKGAVYWHKQDEEKIEVCGGVYLGFGAGKTATDDEDRVLGERVQAVLTEHGFAVEWDGSPAQRIFVSFEPPAERALRAAGYRPATWFRGRSRERQVNRLKWLKEGLQDSRSRRVSFSGGTWLAERYVPGGGWDKQWDRLAAGTDDASLLEWLRDGEPEAPTAPQATAMEVFLTSLGAV